MWASVPSCLIRRAWAGLDVLAVSGKQDLVELRRRFAEPDPRYGPVALWWWSGEPVRAERIRWQLQALSAAGIANLCVIDLAPVAPTAGCAPDEPSFASEQWWELFAVALEEAERLGSRLWFYDQFGFSSANLQARLVAVHPEMAGHRLVRVRSVEPVPAEASFVAEVGDWRFFSVREGFDWLNPTAVAALLDTVHGELERRFGDRLGSSLAGTFQDELPPLPQWSPALSALYQDRFGEDLLELLPDLFGPGERASWVRRGYFSLLGEMAETAFFKPLRSWHDQHGMLIGCDQAGPGRAADPHGAQRLYLDYMRTHRWFSAPGADMDGEAKPHSSMAHLHGGRRVWLEGFHSSGWGGTVEETLHWLVPWLQAGVTLFDPHAVYYSTRGGWWEWAPPDTGWRQPYAPHYPVFADTVARACSVLAEGDHVCDVAIYYPASAIWEHCSLSDGEHGEHPNSVAARDPDEAVRRIRDVYWRLTGRLGRHETVLGVLTEDRRDFDLLDELSLATARVSGGALEVAGERYKAVLLPAAGPRDADARDVLTRFAAEGGLVCAVEPLAGEELTEGAQVVKAAGDVPSVLAGLPRPAEGPGLALRRRVGEGDVYLLLPPPGSLVPMYGPDAGSPSSRDGAAWVHAATRRRPSVPARATYELETQGNPELWDPVSGRRSSLPFERTSRGVRLEVPFEDWPAALVVCGPGEGVPPAEGGQPRRRARPAVVPAAPGPRGASEVSSEGWEVRAVPVLDNRFGDFDLQVPDGFLGPQCRVVRVRHEVGDRVGTAAGWQGPDLDDSGWALRYWTESAAWSCWTGDRASQAQATPVVTSDVFGTMGARTWTGRMGRVPREFLDLGRVAAGEVTWARTHVVAPEDGRYWLVLEGAGDKAAFLDGTEVKTEVRDGGHVSVGQVDLRGGASELVVSVRAAAGGTTRLGVALGATPPEAQPVWLAAPTGAGASLVASLDSPFGPRVVRAHFAVIGRAELWVNGRRVSVLGGFNPYRNEGEDALELSGYWHAGRNEVRVVFPEPDAGTAVLLDGLAEGPAGERFAFCSNTGWRSPAGLPARVAAVSGSTEAHWVRSRPHLLGGVGWLTPEQVPATPPLPFVGEPALLGTPIWFRFVLPVGGESVAVDCAAKEVQLWVAGSEVPMLGGRASFPARHAPEVAALRVVPDGPYTEAGVLRAPISVGVGRAPGRLGDWRSVLRLTSFSGAVDYEREIPAGSRVVDLGYVRGTAEVWVDGFACGVRCWHPYRFLLPEAAGSGRRRLRVRVTNTLGAHYGEGRPSVFVDDAQAVGGMFGPVTIGEDL